MEIGLISKKREIIHLLMKNNVLVSEHLMRKLDDSVSIEKAHRYILSISDKSEYSKLENNLCLLLNSAKRINLRRTDKFYDHVVLQKYSDDFKKREVGDFVAYFTKRYESLREMLTNRQELSGATAISRILAKKDNGPVAVICLVMDKQMTKNNNIILTLEDKTGVMKAIITQKNRELYDISKNILMDEVIGITGMNSGDVIFVNNVFWPDVPLNKELKKTDDDICAVFISDLHVGSIKFIEEDFKKFIQWLNCDLGNDTQREMAAKVKYLLIMGDIVDGVGIYPDQESELDIKDIYKQYEKCAEYLSEIPRDINIIICPGNHDAVRISEPQSVLATKFTSFFSHLPNISFVTSPATINIAAKEGFSGFDILMYHGYSFIFIADNVESIRKEGGIDKPDLIMKYILQRRHIAPTHTATLYIPDRRQDPLVIHKVPDFFVTGHIHKSSVSMYRNVSLISGSCFQSKTSFEERLGLHPEPSRVPVVSLKTRDVKVIKFGKS